MNKKFASVLSVIILVLVVTFLIKSNKKDFLQSKNKKEPKKEKILPAFEVQYLKNPSFNYTVNDTNLIGAKNKKIFFNTDYSKDRNILCFRGNAQRSKPSVGVISKNPTKLAVKWKFQTAVDSRKTKFGVWGGGTGWTGQPLYVEWKTESGWKQNLLGEYQNNTSLNEVIFGSLCGKVYFLDLLSGKPTRNPIDIGNPIKGTVSVDPRLNGMIYIGQGIQYNEKFGCYFYDFFSGKQILHQSGLDNYSYRSWGAFDSNPLVDRENQVLFWPAENGIVYRYDLTDLTKSPFKFKYQVKDKPHQGIESSFGAYRNLGYFSDNNGNVFCLDLSKMKPVWYFDNIDDSDASIALDIENDKPFLLIGNEVDKQGSVGGGFFRKIDGLTGKEVWNVRRTCTGTNSGALSNNGGILSSCLIGKKKSADILITVYSRVGDNLGGEIVAVNKKTGQELYKILLKNYSWSSPVDVYDKDGNMYFVHGDVSGLFSLYEGKTGKIIDSMKLHGAIESSPIAIDNQVIIGTRGGIIYCLTIQ